MAVKRSRSATRMLSVFEEIARTQPVGVSALARELEADKSAVQRDLMTLADAGWIRPAPGLAGQWELSPHILTLARPPHSNESLRLRAGPILERLRTETGETAYLAVPDSDHFVVMAAAESHHLLRMVPAIGIVIPMEGSATARAVLPYLPDEEQQRLLGTVPDAETQREFVRTRARGFTVNDEEIQVGAVAMASAVLGPRGVPLGTLVLTGPAERLTPERREAMGAMLREGARQLAAEIS
ncbi:IclR family transcriptional regulator [Novosphingobium mangrovi (ex Huang et al. 2023)]|uniref:IclR family transcriptional regulator n=1 Tax=Novosphingobium mangrovi (ex Huang et al. 2023) TaxID=2976432 RepID=A0ABT2I340_9SPHN|nr:IclR family transcriptional regulator [Novosphingobium mangrovi (ex Huang et al. 2023)]MCT2399213.1 IclR family transcriptional regulator [Novosphingobium mangrovi (ex Huang et al. 2023)]